MARSVSCALLLLCGASGLAAQAADSIPAGTRAPSWAVRGAVAGSLAGLGLGALTGMGLCDAADCEGSVAVGAAAGLVAGAAAGAMTGWVLGSFQSHDSTLVAMPRPHWEVLAGAAAVRVARTGGFSVSAGLGKRSSRRTHAIVELGYGRIGPAGDSIRFHDGAGGQIVSTSRARRQFGYLGLLSRTDLGRARRWQPIGQARLGLYRGRVQLAHTQRRDDGTPPDGWQDLDITAGSFGVGGGLGTGVRGELGGRPVAIVAEWLAVAGAELDVGGLWTLQAQLRFR